MHAAASSSACAATRVRHWRAADLGADPFSCSCCNIAKCAPARLRAAWCHATVITARHLPLRCFPPSFRMLPSPGRHKGSSAAPPSPPPSTASPSHPRRRLPPPTPFPPWLPSPLPPPHVSPSCCGVACPLPRALLLGCAPALVLGAPSPSSPPASESPPVLRGYLRPAHPRHARAAEVGHGGCRVLRKAAGQHTKQMTAGARQHAPGTRNHPKMLSRGWCWLRTGVTACQRGMRKHTAELNCGSGSGVGQQPMGRAHGLHASVRMRRHKRTPPLASSPAARPPLRHTLTCGTYSLRPAGPASRSSSTPPCSADHRSLKYTMTATSREHSCTLPSSMSTCIGAWCVCWKLQVRGCRWGRQRRLCARAARRCPCGARTRQRGISFVWWLCCFSPHGPAHAPTCTRAGP